jgi:hypothetical protein
VLFYFGFPNGVFAPSLKSFAKPAPSASKKDGW